MARGGGDPGGGGREGGWPREAKEEGPSGPQRENERGRKGVCVVMGVIMVKTPFRW